MTRPVQRFKLLTSLMETSKQPESGVTVVWLGTTLIKFKVISINKVSKPKLNKILGVKFISYELEAVELDGFLVPDVMLPAFEHGTICVRPE